MWVGEGFLDWHLVNLLKVPPPVSMQSWVVCRSEAGQSVFQIPLDHPLSPPEAPPFSQFEMLNVFLLITLMDAFPFFFPPLVFFRSTLLKGGIGKGSRPPTVSWA